MNNVIFLWVNNYRLIDEINGERKFLFNDCGINLSSKFNVSHEWILQDNLHEDEQLHKRRLCITLNECKSRVLFDCNADEDLFYSKCITDLKVIVGKNGVGKSSLLDVVSKIASGNLREEPYLEYCIIWQIDEVHFMYTTNLSKKPEFKSKRKSFIFENSKIEENVFFYSAVFNDEWNYDYPIGGYSHMHDLSTRFLIQQDVENYNNNSDMYANNNKLWCHAVMDSIRQIKFVTDFSYKKKFLNEIFHLPSGVTFVFFFFFIKNAIHQLLDELNEENDFFSKKINNDRDVIKFADDLSDRENKRKRKIENAWIRYFSKIEDLRLKISLTAALSELRTYYNHPFQNEEVSILIDEYPDDDKCIKLIDAIRNKYKISLHENVIDDIYHNLKNASYNAIDKTYSFHLVSQFWLIQNILKDISNLGGHAPIMEMFWTNPLSSGESCYLKLFSRLYDEILKVKRYENENKIEALFLIDEVDLYLHPEWQRMWFSKFIRGIEIMQDNSGVDLKFHLIMATHSPFMITDYFNQSIVKINRDDGNSSCHIVPTEGNCFLAGNIYDILEKAFFLKGSMGYFVESKLRSLVKKANGRRNTKIKLSSSDRFLFDNIGDPVMKSLVYQRLKDKYDLY